MTAFADSEDPPIRVEGKVVSNRYEPGRIPRAYKEMVQTMDQGIGRILTWLKSQELDRQTLVFFFSDNGANRNGRLLAWRLREDCMKGGIACLPLLGGLRRFLPMSSAMI